MFADLAPIKIIDLNANINTDYIIYNCANTVSVVYFILFDININILRKNFFLLILH